MLNITLDALQGSVVIFFPCHLEQVAGIVQLPPDGMEGDDNALQRFLFPAQFLGAFIVIPDGRVFRQPGQFIQASLFAIEVKDTSATLLRGDRDHRAG
jgi:hypothetical protein